MSNPMMQMLNFVINGSKYSFYTSHEEQNAKIRKALSYLDRYAAESEKGKKYFPYPPSHFWAGNKTTRIPPGYGNKKTQIHIHIESVYGDAAVGWTDFSNDIHLMQYLFDDESFLFHTIAHEMKHVFQGKNLFRRILIKLPFFRSMAEKEAWKVGHDFERWYNHEV